MVLSTMGWTPTSGNAVRDSLPKLPNMTMAIEWDIKPLI